MKQFFNQKYRTTNNGYSQKKFALSQPLTKLIIIKYQTKNVDMTTRYFLRQSKAKFTVIFLAFKI